jgi:cytochrome b
VRAYLGGKFAPYIGHNPLGGWSVVAMFAALALQVSLGLFSIDIDCLQPGPLARFLSFDDARAVAHIHHLAFWVIVGLIALHLAAIAVYAARGRNLVAPMLSGRGEIPEGTTAPRTAPLWRTIVIALAAFALAWFVGHGLRWTSPPPSPISGLDS